MTTTVTTTTVTTVTTLGLGVAIGAVLSIALIVLLAGREVAGGSEDERARRWRQSALVAAIPLLLGFGVIAVTKVTAIW
jgi:hypothetical protein